MLSVIWFKVLRSVLALLHFFSVQRTIHVDVLALDFPTEVVFCGPT